MAKFSLLPHPAAPARGVNEVSAQILPVRGKPTEYWVEFYVSHDGSLALPPMLEPGRADELWKTTCFEIFLMPSEGSGYVEINLSPSFRWAAYEFDRYREGMRNLDLAFAPEITITPETPGHFWLETDLDLTHAGSGGARMNVTAVIEERDGTKSYWALEHPDGPPDFHNADCFVARLPAPERA